LKKTAKLPGVTMTILVAICFVSGCDLITQKEPEMYVDPRQARVDARTVLLQSIHSSDPMVRTHAIEAIAHTMGAGEGQALLQGLNDPAVSVRFASAMGIGDVIYRPAEPRLLEIIRNPDSDQRVVVAAIYALHRMGDDSYTGQLAMLLRSELDEGRATTAMVMGKMAEPSAMGPLQTKLADERKPAVRLAITEALARLGDAPSRQMLESYAKQYFLDLRLAVIPVIGELRVNGARRILTQLLNNSKSAPRIRVSAAGALGLLGQCDKHGFQIVQSALENPDKMLRDFYGPKHAVTDVERSSLQQIAALALGRMKENSEQALMVLQPFLQEHDPAVRVAAAQATLQLLPSQPFPNDGTDAAATPASSTPSSMGKKPPRIQSSDGMDELEAR
jgi:HEAT repeat protein